MKGMAIKVISFLCRKYKNENPLIMFTKTMFAKAEKVIDLFSYDIIV